MSCLPPLDHEDQTDPAPVEQRVGRSFADSKVRSVQLAGTADTISDIIEQLAAEGYHKSKSLYVSSDKTNVHIAAGVRNTLVASRVLLGYTTKLSCSTQWNRSVSIVKAMMIQNMTADVILCQLSADSGAWNGMHEGWSYEGSKRERCVAELNVLIDKLCETSQLAAYAHRSDVAQVTDSGPSKPAEGAPAPKRRKREEALVEQSCDVEVPLAKRAEERIQALRATLSRLKIDAPEMSGFMEYAYAAHGHGMMSEAHLLRSWEVFIDAMGRSRG